MYAVNILLKPQMYISITNVYVKVVINYKTFFQKRVRTIFPQWYKIVTEFTKLINFHS